MSKIFLKKKHYFNANFCAEELNRILKGKNIKL